MRKIAIILAALAAVLPGRAQKKTKMEPWQDPNVFEENRMPMRATFTTDQQETLSLNGIWKFNWNETIEGRTKGFEAVGYDDSSWKTMPVPGMWELNGFVIRCMSMSDMPGEVITRIILLTLPQSATMWVNTVVPSRLILLGLASRSASA